MNRLSESTVLTGLSKVPPFPPIAARLLALLANESVSIHELEELVGSDAMLSARLLRCVNSIEFGLAHPVADVGHALALLGVDQTRQITVTLATAAYAKGALRTAALRRCWEHTIATAILSDQIAQACRKFTDIAYTAGIIHDIGRLGLLVAYPRQYERIIREAAGRCLDLLDFEAEQFGVHHANAGRILAERWRLPEELRVVAGRHHDPSEGEEVDLLRIVHVACRLADVLGFDVSRPLVPKAFDEVLAELPDRVRERFQASPDELRARIEQRIRANHDSGVEDPGERSVHGEEAATEEVEAALTEPDPLTVESSPIASRLSARLVVALLIALVLTGMLLRGRW